MKYVMLIYQGAALERQAALPEEEQKQVDADYQGINQTSGVTPGLPMGLPENATSVRVEGGKTLTTDGPFVGMKEAVGGWFILEADDLDAAIEVAARVPAARYGERVARNAQDQDVSRTSPWLRPARRAAMRCPTITAAMISTKTAAPLKSRNRRARVVSSAQPQFVVGHLAPAYRLAR